MESIQVYDFFSKFEENSVNLTEKKAVPALSLRSIRPRAYVEPTLTYLDDAPDHTNPILLISAAGAMGKTFTSMAIADQLNSPRLDLSKVIVGEDSHTGILNRSLTRTSCAEYLRSLDEGTTHLIIDALDEAPIRSGERAFTAFIESLAEHCSEFNVENHQFIILGRPQTTEIFAGICRDAGTGVTRMSLDSLNLDSSLQLIGNEISSYEGGASLIHDKPARDYWREYLFGLARIMQQDDTFKEEDWDTVSDFLGYPPVLCAIAPTLRESNYKREAERLKRGTTRVSSRSNVLTQIINDLLDREATKVQTQLSEVFSGAIEPQRILTFYTHEEQIARILKEFGIESPHAFPVGLPPELRAGYEESIQTFIMDHPFLDGHAAARPRNAVFSDYLRAITNSGTEYFTTLTEKPLAAANLLPVGPFYVHFMEELLSDGEDTEAVSQHKIQSEDYVADIWASWVSSGNSAQRPVLQYVHTGDRKPVIDLFMENRLQLDDQAISPQISFTIQDPTGVLQLKAPLQNMFISTDHCVYISSSAGAITLGPEMTLLARSVETESVDEVVFRSASDPGSRSANYIVTEDLGIVGDYRIRHIGDNPVLVFAPNVDQRWMAFRPNLTKMDGIDPHRVAEATMCVRRILTSFRTTNGVLAIHVDKFNRHVIGRNTLLNAVANAMKKADLIAERGGLMVADQAALSRLGISYDSYSSPDWSSKMYVALRECLNRDGSLYQQLKRG